MVTGHAFETSVLWGKIASYTEKWKYSMGQNFQDMDAEMLSTISNVSARQKPHQSSGNQPEGLRKRPRKVHLAWLVKLMYIKS